MNLLLKIPFRLAINFMLLFLFLVLVFHLCVLFGWVPKTIVWGGRIQTRDQFIMLESSSILINATLVWIIAQRAKYINAILPQKYLNAILW